MKYNMLYIYITYDSSWSSVSHPVEKIDFSGHYPFPALSSLKSWGKNRSSHILNVVQTTITGLQPSDWLKLRIWWCFIHGNKKSLTISCKLLMGSMSVRLGRRLYFNLDLCWEKWHCHVVVSRTYLHETNCQRSMTNIVLPYCISK